MEPIFKLLFFISVAGMATCHGDKHHYAPGDCSISEWSAGLFSGPDPLHMRPMEGVTNPVFSAAQVTDRDAVFTADTFLMPAGSKWYLFFELMDRVSGKGEIAYAWSSDHKHFRYGGVVLDEKFHLSYPYVFKFDGSYYMIPESRQGGGIRLYKAVHFPDKWKFEKELVHGDYVDSSIVQHDGRWWIFTTDVPYSLDIFYADSLYGPWTAHRKNHIYWRNRSKGRSGGRLTAYDGKLLRYAQDSEGGYGHQLRVFVIDELTPLKFREHEAETSPILVPEGQGWRAHSMHTLDPWPLEDGTWIASVDGGGCPPHPRNFPSHLSSISD